MKTLFDDLGFPVQSQLQIRNQVLLAANIFSLDMYTQRFSQTPEPGTLALLGIGLLGIGYARRPKAA